MPPKMRLDCVLIRTAGSRRTLLDRPRCQSLEENLRPRSDFPRPLDLEWDLN